MSEQNPTEDELATLERVKGMTTEEINEMERRLDLGAWSPQSEETTVWKWMVNQVRDSRADR